MKRFLKERMIAWFMIVFIFGTIMNCPVMQHAIPNVNASNYGNIGTYIEEVNGIEWKYEVFKHSDVCTAEYVQPVDKTKLKGMAVVIPDTLGGYPVTRIGLSAFSESDIVSVRIPKSVISIEMYAFADCPNLSKVDIEGTLVNVGYEAFKNCKGLASVTCTVRASSSAFEGCTNLNTVKFVELENSNSCNIDASAFKGCTSLSKVSIASSYTNIDIKDSAFEGCKQLVDISLNGNTTVGLYAFKGCTSLKEIRFAKNATLQTSSFENCTSLESVTINGDASIDTQAPSVSPFKGCTSLKKLTFNGEKVFVELNHFRTVKEVYFNNTKTISGFISGMTGLKEIVFNTINPDMSQFEYFAETNTTPFSIVGYHEGADTAANAGHDTVYKWAEKNNIISSFVNIIWDVKTKYEGESYIGDVPDAGKVKVSVSYYNDPGTYKMVDAAGSPDAVDGYHLNLPEVIQYGTNEYTVSFMDKTIKGSISGMLVKAKELTANVKSEDKLILDKNKGQKVENGILTLVEGQKVSLDMFDITASYNNGTSMSSSNTEFLSKCGIGNYNNMLSVTQSEKLVDIPIIYKETLSNGTVNEMTTNVTVKFVKNQVERIEAVYADKSLKVNSSLERDKIQVAAYYTDGSKVENITNYSINQMSVSEIGQNIFVVTYEGKMGMFYITGIPVVTIIEPPSTETPTTELPITASPITEVSTTTPPITTAPVTDAPITTPPITTTPVTDAPITTPPITTAPVTDAPITVPPITKTPFTDAPITKVPVTTEPVVPQEKNISMKNVTVKLNKTTFYKAYGNLFTKPKVTVKYNQKDLVSGKDYSVKYTKNNKYGKGKVVITGLGQYKGTVNKSFYILPKEVEVTKFKITKKSKIVSIVWKKQKGVAGYHILVSDSKKGKYFAASSKTANDKCKSNLMFKKKGKVYIKIMSYVMIDGKIKYGESGKVRVVNTR